MTLDISVPGVNLIRNSITETNRREIRIVMAINRGCVGLLCKIRRPFFRICEMKILYLIKIKIYAI